MGEKHEALAVSEKTEETQMVLQVDTFPSSFWTVSSHLAGVRVTAACMRWYLDATGLPEGHLFFSGIALQPFSQRLQPLFGSI